MEKVKFCGYDLKTRAMLKDTITAHFNPEHYTIQANNSFKVDSDDRSANRSFDFTYLSRKPATLSMELLFDTYEHGASESSMADVRQSCAMLRKYMRVTPDKHTPPCVMAAWSSLCFVGVVESLRETFTMFLPNGKPVRAKVELSISGCREEDLSVSPNQSPDRTKQRVVVQGETIWDIANREYGSPERWRAIARANGIRNPRRLPPAQRLVIPALPGGED